MEEFTDDSGSSYRLAVQKPVYIMDSDGRETNEPAGYQCPIFCSDRQFDEIRSTSNQKSPTTQQLKKKFEEFLEIFVPLYRPVAAPAKYADLESITDQEGLRCDLEEKLLESISTSERLATWYLFCALHDSGVFAREKLGGSVLAHYATR